MNERSVAVLDAALELFHEAGYGATPVPAIAQRAGMATGSVYRHFPSKAALANALYLRWKSELARRLFAGVPEGATPRQEFGHYWRNLVGFALAHPQALSFLESHHHAPYLAEDSRSASAELDARLAQYVRRAQKAGAVRRGDPKRLVAFVYGGFLGAWRSGAGRRGLLQLEEAAWSAIAVSRPAP